MIIDCDSVNFVQAMYNPLESHVVNDHYMVDGSWLW